MRASELPSLRGWLATASLALTAFVACDGCQGPSAPPAAQVPKPVKRPVVEELGESLVLDIEADRLLLAGKLDKENRYASAVVVTTRVRDQLKHCSGVLVDRRAVLTAGHCVCVSPSAALIDTSSCAQTANVTTILYTPVEGLEETANSISQLYFGVVHPHPALRVLLNDQGEVVSSVADLALIHLTSPVEKAIHPLSLADKEVQLSEALIIAGQAYDEVFDRYDENRRFSRNTATRLPMAGDSRILVRQPSGHPYKGDSGGPCLRESLEHSLLVGISSRNLGKGAACTSIHAYRDWVRSELRHPVEVKVP